MKYLYLPVLILFFFPLIFGNDAKVLSKNELRLTVANHAFAMAFEDEEEDKTTEIFRDSLAGDVKYGISDNLTAAILFEPGVNIFSSIKEESLSTPDFEERISYAGMGDMKVGLKYKALERHNIDFALSANVTFPLDSFDLGEEIDNFYQGDDFRLFGSQSDTEGMGFTFSNSMDIKISKSFTLNLFTKLNHHFLVEKYDDEKIITFIEEYYDLITNHGYTASNAKKEAKDTVNETETFNYGTDIILEIEPRWRVDLNNQSLINIGLPINYEYNPDVYIDGERKAFSGMINYTLRPVFSFMTYKRIPFELQIQYNLSLIGIKESSIILSGRLYLDL